MSRTRRNTRSKSSERDEELGSTKKFYSDKDEKSRSNPKFKKKSGNDPAWYAADPVLLRDAASYPFSYNTGATEIHDSTAWNEPDISGTPASQIPGICSLHVYPCVGTANAATDPINVAAQSVYSFVRHANSGHSNYDAPDLMLYILAMANMYSFLVWCQRLYGYALTYDQRNRYVPNDLIRTNNVDAGDLISNLANFRFWVNTLIAKMASFAVPATMSIFSRMSFIYSDYYIEGTSIKDQLYQFVPEGFYQFGIDSQSLGELAWVPFDYTTLMSTQDVMNYGDTLFNAIWSQEDFGIMSGDILKAYGDRIIKLVSIPEYYNIVPKFDPMVLTQMKNADLVRVIPTRIAQNANASEILQYLTPLGFTTTDVMYGTTNALSSAAATIFNAVMRATIKDYRILTVDTDNPTPDVVIEATRLKVAYDVAKAWYKAGTEVITHAVITGEPGVDLPVYGIIATLTNSTNEHPTLTATFALEEAARSFHYMPRFWLAFLKGDTNKAYVRQSLDIDNFTLLNYDDVRKLHEAATVNMFAVPSIGKVQ